MKNLKSNSTSASRVARHRKAISATGGKRVEVTVPANDAKLIKAVAGVLRSGGVSARQVRETLHPMLSVPKARTGKELVEFLHMSPLAETELDIERDLSTGRTVEFD